MIDIDPQLDARHALYQLLARLYLGALDAELVAELRALPGFAEHAPTNADESHWLDEMAVEYERLFGRNIYPYESIFRDRELMLNTASADRVAALYAAYAVDARWAQVGAPDHLGLELSLMAELLAREAQALALVDARATQHARKGQARCLHEHLAHWAPICALTLKRLAGHPIYVALATLTIELVLSDLAATQFNTSTLEQTPMMLVQHDDSMDEERGLGQVVRRLLIPTEAGLMLTRADIGTLGRGLGLPAPIGEREQMLRGLFESAGQFTQVPALLEALDGLFQEADGAVAGMMREYAGWEAYGAMWQARIAASRALLHDLRVQAGDLDPLG